MQHGMPSKRTLCFNLSSREIPSSNKNYLHKVPIPKKIIVEDNKSKNLYENFGYKDILVIKGGINEWVKNGNDINYTTSTD